MKKSKIIRIFSCCYTVRGYSSGLIIDVQRNKYYKVPLSLIDIFDGATTSYNELRSSMNESERKIVDEYQSFLESKELIYSIDPNEIDLFPPLSLSWDFPAQISNALVEIYSDKRLMMARTLKQIESLFCPSLFVTVCSNMHNSDIVEIIEELVSFSFESITIHIKLDILSCDNFEKIKNLCDSYPQISKIVIFCENAKTFNCK